MTGVNLEGAFIQDHCIPCLVGKSPQHSYPSQGNRAMKIGELLHMDLCRLFPVQVPHGKKYFYNILDDKLNWGFTYGLRLKSDAFPHYLRTEALLERSSGTSDVQGLGKPLGFKGKGQEGKGQGKDFMTLRKPLPLAGVRGFGG